MSGESYPPNKPAFRPDPSNAENLQIPVAEDDPINRKMVQKQLEKLGHSLDLTVNEPSVEKIAPTRLEIAPTCLTRF